MYWESKSKGRIAVVRCLVVQYISIIGSFYHPDGLFDHNFHLTAAVVGIKSVGWCTSDWMEWW